MKSYVNWKNDVVEAAQNSRCEQKDDIRLIDLGPILLCSTYQLTNISWNHLKDSNPAHIVSLRYKLLTSAKDTDELCIGFDRDRVSKQRELANNRTVERKNQVRTMLKDVLVLQNTRKTTSGLVYKLLPTNNINNAIFYQAEAIVDAKSVIINIHCFLPHHTPFITQQSLSSKQFLSKTMEIQLVEKSANMKNVIDQKLWIFEPVSQQGIIVPFFNICGFQQRDMQNSRNLNNDASR